MSSERAPCSTCPDAVAADGVDARRRRPLRLASTASSARSRPGDGFVDLSHRDVLRIAGPDRLTWLHSLTTQHLTDLPPGEWTRRWC